MDKTTVYEFDRFLEIEEKYEFFNCMAKEIKFWQYIRFSYCTEILKEITGIKTTAPESFKIIEQNGNENIIDSFFKKSQFLLKKKDILVVNHPRRVKEGDYYKCFVTDELLQHIRKSYYVFEDEYKGKHFEPIKTKHLKYRNIQAFKNSSIFPKETDEYKADLCKGVKNIISIFEKEYQCIFNNDFKSKLVNMACGIVKDILIAQKYSEVILQLVRPKIVIVTVAYNIYNLALVEVAKSMGIPTVELQHGRIGDSHAAYNFPKNVIVESFPDYLFVYGKYERDIPRYPIDRKCVIPVGYPELEKKYLYYKGRIKEGKTALFISSPVEGEIVAKYAVWLQKNCNIKVVYKLHPTEYYDWCEKYPELIDNKVEVVDNNLHDIYYYIAKSDFVIGISSTVLFEAMQFDTRIIIIKEQDYLKSKVIYENGNGVLISSYEEMNNIVLDDASKSTRNEVGFYFEKDSVNNMKKAIRQCIQDNRGRKGNIERWNIKKRYRIFTKLAMYNLKKNERKENGGLSQKNLALYMLMNRWLMIKQNGESLVSYFEEYNYKKIAIYGMNYVGEALKKELENSDITVCFGIDRNAEALYSDIEIVKPIDKFEKVDIIVITPIFYYSEIVTQLNKEHEGCKCVSIQTIVDAVSLDKNLKV